VQQELRAELLSERYGQEHPDVLTANREREQATRDLEDARSTLKTECMEGIQTPGRWIPEGITLEEWNGIKAEIQQAFNAFDVLRSSFNPDPPELFLEVLDFDVRAGVHLVKQAQDWVVVQAE
jgi:hypothetical protein